MLKEIDIKAGAMTFGQRIELGKIFSNQDLPEIEKFCQTFECLHDIRPKAKDFSKYVPYFTRIAEGMLHWAEMESTHLKHEPTPKQVAAGIKKLSEKTGDMGTVISLASRFTYTLDEVLLLNYSVVFVILLDDLEKYKYEKRFMEMK